MDATEHHFTRRQKLSPAEVKQLLREGADPHVKAGRQWESQADLFIAKWPVGEEFTTKEFDIWAAEHGLYVYEQDAKPDSKEWMAMLQWRHRWLGRIRTAAAHPYRNSRPGGAFTIERIAGERYEVCSTWKSIQTRKTSLVSQVETLIEGRVDFLERLMASTDWNLLQIAEQEYLWDLYDDLLDYKGTLGQQTQQLNERFERRVLRIRDRMARGELVPTNGILKSLLPAGVPKSTTATDQESVTEPKEEPFC